MKLEDITREENLCMKYTTRAVYAYNKYLYKVALNCVGLQSNINECNISKNELLPFKMVSYTDDYKIIRTKSRDVEIKFGNEDLFQNYFGVSKSDVVTCLDYFYFMLNISRLGLLSIIKNLNPARSHELYFKNKKIKEVCDFLLKYRIEPNEVIGLMSFYNNRLKLFDFGLTEENYFNNMFMVCLYSKEDKIICRFCYFKNFDGNYYNVLPKKKIFGTLPEIFIQFSLFDRMFIDRYQLVKPTNNIVNYNVETKEFYL